MCPPPALVWACLALFCSHQHHVFATPPVFYLVTDIRLVTGPNSESCHHSNQSRHPLYWPLGFGIHQIWRAPSISDHQSPSRDTLTFLLPIGIVQSCHGHRALLSVRPHARMSRHPVSCLDRLLGSSPEPTRRPTRTN